MARQAGLPACPLPLSAEDSRGARAANAIGSAHRRCRELNQAKSAFNGDNVLFNLLRAAIKSAEKKWAMPISDRGMVLPRPALIPKDQMRGTLDSSLGECEWNWRRILDAP